jgi:opacity protein-like surface antigen
MKHLGLKACLLFAALGIATSVSAQTRLHAGLGGGATLPLGSTSDALKTGWHGMVSLLVLPGGSPVGIQIDGMYHRIPGDPDVLGTDDLDTQIINGTVNAVFKFPVAEESRFGPYLIGGVGYYNFKAVGDDVPSGVDDSSSDFGLNAGAGFDIALGSRAGLFVEGRFHNVFTDVEDTKFIPITAGVKFALGGSDATR